MPLIVDAKPFTVHSMLPGSYLFSLFFFTILDLLIGGL